MYDSFYFLLFYFVAGVLDVDTTTALKNMTAAQKILLQPKGAFPNIGRVPALTTSRQVMGRLQRATKWSA